MEILLYFLQSEKVSINFPSISGLEEIICFQIVLLESSSVEDIYLGRGPTEVHLSLLISFTSFTMTDGEVLICFMHEACAFFTPGPGTNCLPK